MAGSARESTDSQTFDSGWSLAALHSGGMTPKTRLALALVIWLPAVGCGSDGGGTPTQPRTAILRGVVHVIPTGPPIDGVTVTAQGKTVVTSAQGNFTITELSTGDVDVNLSRTGYVRTTLRVTLNAGDNFFSLGMSPE